MVAIGFGRMGFSVDVLQPLDADVRVDLGCVESGVTEELLQRTEIRPVFHHQRCSRVAK